MSKRPILIALNSPAPQSGKSTVAEYLVSEHGFKLLKFAAPLKDMIRTLLRDHCGISVVDTERYVEGDLKETIIVELGVTCRHLMQTIGTEWGRDCVRKDLWVHIVRESVLREFDVDNNVVIDDMRFLNEYDMVNVLGGMAVRVVNPRVTPVSTLHCSEGALDKFDMGILFNNSTIADLHLDVDALVQRLSA